MVVARWKLGTLVPERIPDIACRALEQGLDTPTLCVLAAMSEPTLRDIDGALQDLICELSLDDPNATVAGMSIAKQYAAQIMAGDLAPYDGACRIWHEVYRHSGEPDELYDFVSAASEIEDYRFVRDGAPAAYDERIAECEAVIRDRAQVLLNS